MKMVRMELMDKIGTDGENGEDGYSPTVNISKSGITTTIVITDRNGEHIATINDGETYDDSALIARIDTLEQDKLDKNKIKTSISSTSGDIYDVTYINNVLGDIETILTRLTTGGGVQ